ncbi:MAG: lipase family protein [Ruminococcaceae bacterium]|nr:lipase family protein [Oscillospiraceae bacterium]
MKVDLCDIFEKCLSAKYIHVENDGSYSSYTVDKTRYIFFQQSNGKTDWMNNFDFPSKAYKGMDIPWRCHRGFLKVWKSILPYVEKLLKTSSFESAVVVGYSHGAALSALCFEYVWYNYPDIRNNLYGFSFGSPRIFYGKRNYSFLKERFSKYINVINSDDIVTKVPPSILGYRHMGKLLYIGRDKKFFSINAHRAESYRESLKEIRCIIDV